MTKVEDEIRAAQERSVTDVEAQLAAGAPRILIEGREISREAAWAATQALRACWRAGIRYDGQHKTFGGWWVARGERHTRTLLGRKRVEHVEIKIGRFPG